MKVKTSSKSRKSSGKRGKVAVAEQRVLDRIQQYEKGVKAARQDLEAKFGKVDGSNMSAEQHIASRLVGMYGLWLGSAANATRFASRNSQLWKVASNVVSRLPDKVVEEIPGYGDCWPDSVNLAIAAAVVDVGLKDLPYPRVACSKSKKSIEWKPCVNRSSVVRVRFLEVCEGCGGVGTIERTSKGPEKCGDTLYADGRCSVCGMPCKIVTKLYNGSVDEYKQSLLDEFKRAVKSGAIKI